MIVEFIVNFILSILTWVLNLIPSYDTTVIFIDDFIRPSIEMFYLLVTKPVGQYLFYSITFWLLAYPIFIALKWLITSIQLAFSAK